MKMNNQKKFFEIWECKEFLYIFPSFIILYNFVYNYGDFLNLLKQLLFSFNILLFKLFNKRP